VGCLLVFMYRRDAACLGAGYEAAAQSHAISGACGVGMLFNYLGQ